MWSENQIYLNLCNPMDYTVHGILQARILGSHFLLQGIFPTQEMNPGLPHCRQIHNSLKSPGSPRIMEGVAYPFSGSSQLRNRTGISCTVGGFFTNINLLILDWTIQNKKLKIFLGQKCQIWGTLCNLYNYICDLLYNPVYSRLNHIKLPIFDFFDQENSFKLLISHGSI